MLDTAMFHRTLILFLVFIGMLLVIRYIVRGTSEK